MKSGEDFRKGGEGNAVGGFGGGGGAGQQPFGAVQASSNGTITLVVSSIASAYYPDYGVVMVASVLATLPTLIVFFAMQRQFVEGMLGSIK